MIKSIRMHVIDTNVLKATWEPLTDIKNHTRYALNYKQNNTNLDFEITCLADVQAMSHNGWVFQDGFFHQMFSWYKGHSFLPEMYQIKPASKIHSQSKILMKKKLIKSGFWTVSDFSNVYGHVLTDEIPKILYLSSVNILDKTIYCSPLAKKLIRRFKVSDALLNALVPVDADTEYTFKEIYLVSTDSLSMNIGEKSLQLLRTMYKDNLSARKDCMLILRDSKARNLQNISTLEEVLGGLANSVSFKDVEDPPTLFIGSDVVIGVHGSDLIDCIFMKAGTTIIEIMPTDHIKPYHFNICKKLGINYVCVHAISAKQRNTRLGPSNASCILSKIDMELIKERIKSISKC